MLYLATLAAQFFPQAGNILSFELPCHSLLLLSHHLDGHSLYFSSYFISLAKHSLESQEVKSEKMW